jgi:hypothetical protein
MNKTQINELAVSRLKSTAALVSNSRGQSLIQVMVSAAIMGILAMAFVSMLSTQQRQTSQLSQKLASLDVERTITAALADGTVCNYMLAAKPQVTSLNPTSLPAPTTVITPFVEIPMTASATAPPAAIIAIPPVAASPMSPSLFIGSIGLTGVVCSGSCATTTPQFNGKIVVGFDNTHNQLVIPLAPLSFPVIFTLNTVSHAIGCMGSNQAMVNCVQSGGTWSTTTNTCTGGMANQICNGQQLPPAGTVVSPWKSLGGGTCRVLANCQITTGASQNNPGQLLSGTVSTGNIVCGPAGWACAGSSCWL